MFSFGETQVLTIKKKTQLQRGQLDTPGALLPSICTATALHEEERKKKKEKETQYTIDFSIKLS